MKEDRSGDPGQLATLQRWRSLELETAQTEHALLAQVAVEKQSAVDLVESRIADSQSFARDQLTGSGPLSTQTLRGFAEFAAVQAQELTAARVALGESKTHLDSAHASVVRHFERLCVVERLRERRDAQIARNSQRTAQKLLDEHALSRLSGTTGTDTNATNEE